MGGSLHPTSGLRLRADGLRSKFLVAALASGAMALISAGGATAGPAVSQTMPFAFAGVNMCTGEPFTGSGQLHLVSSDNLSASGAIEHHLDASINGLQAVTPTGKKYVVQDTESDEFVISGASEETFNITEHFIRVGEDGTFILGDDFYEYIRTHITANANGVVTAYRVQTNDMPCQ